MSDEFIEEIVIKCPQCNTELDNPSCRLVQDSCGHRKCRLCLLNDEANCRLCTIIEIIDEPINNHTAVITYQNKGCDDISSSLIPTNNRLENNINNEVDVQGHKSEDCTEKRIYNSLITPSHIILNEELKLYTCSFCKKSFNTRSHIKYHFYCSGAKKPFQCDICKKEFIVKYHLQTHMLVHLDKKQFSCDKCNKTFIARNKLNRHKLIHTDERSFTCPECGKSFKNKENLRTHTAIHQPEKPYACNECNAKFSNSSNFRKHVQIHAREKAHMCDTCGKRFKLKWALSLHKKSHLKFRNNQCAICSKSFVHAKDLHRHELIHLDVKGFTCGICDASFKRKDNLHRHTKNTHPGKNAIVIRNTIKKKIIKQEKRVNHIVDNPNAINVITASPAFSNAKLQQSIPKEDRCPVAVINAPLKLAFKTSAFKNHYNIHRDYIEPAENVESVNIYEKILLPNVPSQTSNQTKKTTIPEEESYVINQKTLSPFSAPRHYETSFDNKKHAVIKNIKFKLPAEYTNLRIKEINKEIALSSDSSDDNVAVDVATTPNMCTELRTATTSVIVNTPISQQNDMHWRRRTAQNLNRT